jgi:hypothetical protein
MTLEDERTKIAYDTFRGGFRDGTCPVPHWDEAPSWVRDVARVAYSQGFLDGMSKGEARAAARYIADADIIIAPAPEEIKH